MSRTTARPGLACCPLPSLLRLGNGVRCRSGGDRNSAATASARPRVGLVLAGGGAKGGAHVGVLKVLEEMHVPIDCIAGTSMGALVGGGYASGIPAAGLEKFVVGIDWKSVVGGAGRRDLQTDRAEARRASPTATTSSSACRTSGSCCPAASSTPATSRTCCAATSRASRAQADFDKLPIPYRAVATDMVSGKMVVLDGRRPRHRDAREHGDSRAPSRRWCTDKYILSDGGMVRNIPVDVARDLCADVVIVVNLVEQELKREKLQTATAAAHAQHGRDDHGQREPAAATP